MRIDGFTGLEPTSLNRRIERSINPKTRTPKEVTRELVEFSLVLESRDQYDRMYRYFTGRRLVYIADWKYDDGFYIIRNFLMNTEATTFTMDLSADYVGKEIIEDFDSNPMEPAYRVIVEDDFSGWSTGAITWGARSGVGVQYESVNWDRHSTGTNMYIVATSSSYERPDGSSGKIMRITGTADRTAIIEDLQEYNALEVRASVASPGAEDGIGIAFKVLEYDYSDPKRGLFLMATTTEVRLYRFKSSGTYDILRTWSLPAGEARPQATSDAEVHTDEWYELMVRLYGPIIEIYFNSKFVDFLKWDWLKSGTVGLTTTDAGFCSDFVVKRIPVPVHSLPVGSYNISEFVHDAVYSKDGWVQRVIQPYEPVKQFIKDHTKGIVNVWDMRDGDFRHPWRWELVTDPSHEFRGNVFVENGVCGIYYDGSDLYYYHSEHLKDILVGFDTSAWWSQGYALHNVAPLKTFLSPTTMQGSLFRHYRWKDPFWFLNIRDKWQQSRTFNFGLLTNPELEADFFIQSWLPDGTYNSGSRIISYNETAVREGVFLCNPTGVLQGGYSKDSSTEALLAGATTLVSSQSYRSKYVHAADARLLFLNNKLDGYSQVAPVHAVYESAGATLIPLREETGTIVPTLGGISKMILRDRRLGHQTFRGLDSSEIVAWYSFDRADFDRSLGSWGQFRDLSGNGNHLEIDNTNSDDPGEMKNGVINEALTLQGGDSSARTIYRNTSISGHTSDAEFGVSFWIKFNTDVTANETTDVDYIRITRADNTDLCKLYFNWMTQTFDVYYGVDGHAVIANSKLDDQKFHLIVITDRYVMVDGVQHGGSYHAITGQIGRIYLHETGGMVANSKYTIDELVVFDLCTSSDYDLEDHAPSYSDIPIQTTKQLKSEFDADGNRWTNWDPKDLFFHFIFDDGAEDLSPNQWTLSTVSNAGNFGFYKQYGFVRARGNPITFNIGSDTKSFPNGFTVMWKGTLQDVANIVDLMQSGPASAIKISSNESDLEVTVDTPSGTNTYTKTLVEGDYHEFWLTYHSDYGAQLWVDETKQTWTSTTGGYSDDPEPLTGLQYMGGSLTSDLVLIAKVVEPDQRGYHEQEEMWWKEYYKFAYNDGSVQSMGKPAFTLIKRNAAEVIFGGKYEVRLEMGNPLISIIDLYRADDALYIYDQSDEWSIVASKSSLYDARQGGGTQYVSQADSHKFILVPHLKTHNGLAVMSGLEQGSTTAFDIVGRVFQNARMLQCNSAVVGFINFPIWNFWKEGGDADTFSGTAVRDKDANEFFSVGDLPNAGGPSAKYQFTGLNLGSYLLLVRVEIGAGNVWRIIGDAGDTDRHKQSANITATYTNTFSFGFSDLATESTYPHVEILLGTGGVGETGKIDYVAILPLSNGLNFPIDFIQQIWARNG